MNKKIFSVNVKSDHFATLNAVYGFAVCNENSIFKNMPVNDQIEMRQALAQFFKTYLDLNQNLQKKDRPTQIHAGGDSKSLFKMIELAKAFRKMIKQNDLRIREIMGDKGYSSIVLRLDECCKDMGAIEKQYKKHLEKRKD